VVYTIAFIIDYLFYFSAASDALRHFFNVYIVIDLLAILPPFSAFSGSLAPSFLSALRAVRALRVLRTYRITSFAGDTLQRRIVMICFSVFGMLYIFSCFAYITELEYGRGQSRVTSFHVAVYWMIVTVTTTGYGDISPSSEESQAVMGLMMAFSWFVMSINLAKLISLIGEASSYGGALQWTSDVPHVVVCGSVTHDGLKHVLRELFHPTNSHDKQVNVAVLLPERPSVDLIGLQNNPQYDEKLQFLVGSPLFDSDLARVRLQDASAVFLLTDKYASDPESVDISIILQALAVAEFAPDLRWSTYVQLIRRESKAHLVAAGIPNVISVDEMKFGILGQASVAPGVSTIVSNLVRAFKVKPDATTAPFHVELNSVRSPMSSWLQEYRLGCLSQLRSQGLDTYVEQPVGQLLCALFLTNGALLFALETWENGVRRIIVKPKMSRLVQVGDIGYFIASVHETDVTLERSTQSVPERLALGRTKFDEAFEAAHQRKPTKPTFTGAAAAAMSAAAATSAGVIAAGLSARSAAAQKAAEPVSAAADDDRGEPVNLFNGAGADDSEMQSIQSLASLESEAPPPMLATAFSRTRLLAQSVAAPVVNETMLMRCREIPQASRLAAVLLDEQVEDAAAEQEAQEARELKRPVFYIEDLVDASRAQGTLDDTSATISRLRGVVPPAQSYDRRALLRATRPRTVVDPDVPAVVPRSPQVLDNGAASDEELWSESSSARVSSPRSLPTIGSANDSSSGSSRSAVPAPPPKAVEPLAAEPAAKPSLRQALLRSRGSTNRSRSAMAIETELVDVTPVRARSLDATRMASQEPSSAAVPFGESEDDEEDDDDDNNASEEELVFIVDDPSPDATRHRSSKRSDTKAKRRELMANTGRAEQLFLSNVFDGDDVSHLDDAEQLADHVLVVVCGAPTEDIVDVIAPMRSRLLISHKAIVVLFELMPSDTQWREIGKLSEGFGNIQFIHGNPLLHLAYGSISTASQVLVLNCKERNWAQLGAFDAAVVVISRSIESRFPNLFVLSELSEGTSIRFLGTGRLGASDPQVVDDGFDSSDFTFRPRFAAGRVFAVSMLDTLLARTFSNPAVLAVIKLIVSSTHRSTKIYVVPLAPRFANKRYDVIFPKLAVRDILLLGIFRTAGNLGASLPYVFTNPPPNTVLHAGDRLFVLADAQPNAQFEMPRSAAASNK
jgi:hypothetical protein